MKKILMRAATTLVLFSLPVLAEEYSFPHIETSGYGEVIVKPNMAEFTVRVEESTITVEDAKDKVDEVVTSFMDRLTATGVSRDDISATNIRLSPRYNRDKSGNSELVGYQATRSITVVVTQLDNLNTYINGALGDGINRIDSIHLKVTDEEKYQEMARLAAIQDANEKAKSLADGFGLDIKGVWRISYNNSHAKPVMAKAMAMDHGLESSNSGYQDTTLTIREQLSVTYRLAE